MKSAPILVPRTSFESSFFHQNYVIIHYDLCYCGLEDTQFYRFYLIWQIVFYNIYHDLVSQINSDMGPQQGIFGKPPFFIF